MKKLKINLESMDMLTKEQMKQIGGGGDCDCFGVYCVTSTPGLSREYVLFEYSNFCDSDNDFLLESQCIAAGYSLGAACFCGFGCG